MDLTALTLAVTALVEHDDASWLYAALVAAVKMQRDYPVALIGRGAVVNPLLALALEDPEAYARVLALVETKRALAELPPLHPPPEDGFDKTAYMRDFMDRKRQRQRRAAEIENYLRPARAALKGKARIEYMDRVAAGWKARLDELIDKARAAQGPRLSAEVLETIRSQFWQSVDEELDAAAEEARRKLRR
jgi:hypothetical protein